MSKLIYSTITSLDGFVADVEGRFDWAAPDEEVHAFVNDLERPVGTYLYGRRMYQTMAYWESPSLDGQPTAFTDYAGIWQAADKVVYSTTLDDVGTRRTRLERAFDADAVRRWKASEDRDLSIGGAHLASQAVAAGVVDELHMFVVPVLVGGGTPFLAGGVPVDLRLLAERRFDGGVVHLHYSLRV